MYWTICFRNIAILLQVRIHLSAAFVIVHYLLFAISVKSGFEEVTIWKLMWGYILVKDPTVAPIVIENLYKWQIWDGIFNIILVNNHYLPRGISALLRKKKFWISQEFHEAARRIFFTYFSSAYLTMILQFLRNKKTLFKTQTHFLVDFVKHIFYILIRADCQKCYV